MALSRLKTWGVEVLTATDLNAEFNNILNNPVSLVSPLTAALDMDAFKLILDADADTSITADTDDQIDFELSGADDFRMTANTLTALDGSSVVVGGTGQAIGSETSTAQVVGTAAADSSLSLGRWSADASGPLIKLLKSRNATIGSSTIVQNSDTLGTLGFYADDGTDFVTPGATIHAVVQGTPGANDLPTSLVFSVTADGASTVSEAMRIRTAGEVTMPLQSAFFAYASAAQNNFSGNGTLATIVFGTEIGDANADFASNTYTASQTGWHYLAYNVTVTGFVAAASTNHEIYVAGTSAYTYQLGEVWATGTPSTASFHQAIKVYMTAGDTAIVRIQAYNQVGDVLDVSVYGAPVVPTYFCGGLIS